MSEEFTEEEGEGSEKSFTTALLLCFFLGLFGAHRFYVGRYISGIITLLTFGGFIVWHIIDSIVLLNGTFKDDKGLKLRP